MTITKITYYKSVDPSAGFIRAHKLSALFVQILWFGIVLIWSNVDSAQVTEFSGSPCLNSNK